MTFEPETMTESSPSRCARQFAEDPASACHTLADPLA